MQAMKMFVVAFHHLETGILNLKTSDYHVAFLHRRGNEYNKRNLVDLWVSGVVAVVFLRIMF